MSRRMKILGACVALPAAAVLSAMVVLSRDAPCGETDAGAVPEEAAVMKAITHRCYGSYEVLRLEDVPRPTPSDEEVLVRVRAAAINPLEWHYVHGVPYIMRLSSGLGRPDDVRLGVDFAGTVEAVGGNVTGFRPGDDVFGGRNGALAEYVVVRQDRIIAHKPANVSFEDAAAVPVAATTALQALRDAGRVGPGQRVLINGASGGVGTYAVQIARSLGAHVTGVSSTRNLELVRSLGADHMIDYTVENFTEGSERWDVIIDNVGNHPLRAYRRVLTPEGIVVLVTGPKKDPWLGPVLYAVRGATYSRVVSQTFVPFLSELRREDLLVLRGLMESGELRSVLDGHHPLVEVPAALEYLGTGRTRGKNVILVAADP